MILAVTVVICKFLDGRHSLFSPLFTLFLIKSIATVVSFPSELVPT